MRLWVAVAVFCLSFICGPNPGMATEIQIFKPPLHVSLPRPVMAEGVQAVKARAKAGQVKAQHNLGVYYLLGWYYPMLYKRPKEAWKDHGLKARRWFRKAADQGYADSQYALGLIYDEGEGVLRDWRKAQPWYLKAASAGHSGAQFRLGIISLQVMQKPEGYQKAREWFFKAAQKGHVYAQGNLGQLYLFGFGDERDPKTAGKWIYRAADKGLVGAQCILGIMHASGVGVHSNLVASCKWLILANSTRSFKWTTILKEVTDKMTLAQITEANKLAKDWYWEWGKRKYRGVRGVVVSD